MEGSIKTVLITGANGFIANQLSRTLHLAGYKLALLDQQFDSHSKDFWIQEGVALYETEVGSFQEKLSIDTVIHAATLTAEAHELKMTAESYLKTNLDTNFHMISWARANRVKRFIFISSAGVFSAQQKGPLTEQSATLSKSLYALAKRCTEDLLETIYKELESVSVRLGNVYGENEQARSSRPRVSLLQRMLNQALEQGRIVVPNESPRDWTYCQDIAKLIQRLIEIPKPASQLYHLVSNESFTALEIAQKIQQELVNIKLELSQGKATQLRGLLTSKYLSEAGFTHWTPFDEGLKKVIDKQKKALDSLVVPL